MNVGDSIYKRNTFIGIVLAEHNGRFLIRWANGRTGHGRAHYAVFSDCTFVSDMRRNAAAVIQNRIAAISRDVKRRQHELWRDAIDAEQDSRYVTSYRVDYHRASKQFKLVWR